LCRDQKSGDDEEDVDADVAARDPRPAVKEDDEDDGDCPESFDVWPEPSRTLVLGRHDVADRRRWR
jgi:hypothetical protein